MSDMIRGPWSETGSSDWSIDTDGENTYVFIQDVNGDPVAIVAVDSAFEKDAELDAKAALIAAAPELLEALKMFRDACDDAVLVENDHPQVAFKECLLTALQVIAKAEGRE